MKKINLLMLSMLAALCMTFVSCDDCDCDDSTPSTSKVPTVDFDVKFNAFRISVGAPLIVTPTVNEAKSDPGVKIFSVKYYWDGTLIAAQTSAPFVLNFPIVGQEIGKHKLTFSPTYGGDDYKTMEANFDYDVEVIEATKMLADARFTPGQEVKNGEPFKCEAFLDMSKTSDGVVLKSVDFLWDGTLLSSVTSAPFILETTFTNETVGKHRLGIKYYVTVDGTATDATFTWDVTIVE